MTKVVLAILLTVLPQGPKTLSTKVLTTSPPWAPSAALHKACSGSDGRRPGGVDGVRCGRQAQWGGWGQVGRGQAGQSIRDKELSKFLVFGRKGKLAPRTRWAMGHVLASEMEP